MTLTIEQAITAKQQASHPDGWSLCFYDQGRYCEAVWHEGSLQVPQVGWQHAGGCDCEFCREEAK